MVYVDHDPVAVAHSRALLRGNGHATAIAGDIREPSKVLTDAVTTGLLDLARPVAVLFIAVLHFIDNADRPAELIGQYMDATAPGSYLAISHAMAVDRPSVNNAAKVYEQSRSPSAMRFRSRAEIEALFGNVTLVDPGVVLVPRWHPELTDDSRHRRWRRRDTPAWWDWGAAADRPRAAKRPRRRPAVRTADSWRGCGNRRWSGPAWCR